MIHVTIQQLSSYLDGQLAEASAELVRQHVAACPDCASKLEAMTRVDETLFRVLATNPDPSVLDRLIEEVGWSIGGRKRKDPGSRPTPEKAALAGATAAERSASPRPSASEMTPPMTAPPRRSSPTPSARKPVPSRERRPRSSPAVPWLVVFILALIAGSAGVVVSRSDWVRSWLDVIDGSLAGRPSLAGTATPDATTPVAPDAAVPGAEQTEGTSPGLLDPSSGSADQAASKDDETEAEPAVPPPPDESAEPATMRADESLAAPATSPGAGSDASDPFASLRADLRAPLRAAERLTNEATLDPSAARYDAAGRAWERAIEGMGGLPEQVVARGRLADARYRAWLALPDAVHAQQAEEALRSYLLFAPAGALREQANARLERVR